MFRRKLFRVSLFAIALVGMSAAPLLAQTPLPPLPGGADNTEFYSEDDAEALNRGALHEAFVAPVDNEPVVGIIVHKQPPDPIDEVPPDVKPEGENIVWISGYFSFDEELDDFVWISGMWRDVPPGRTWVPGYWHEIEGGWQWVHGYWADESAEEITYQPEPPPTQEYGPSSPSPGNNYFYIPGSWLYVNYNYSWRPGYWAPYQPNWIWVPARYIFTPRGYVYIPGYWDYLLGYRGVVYAPIHFHRYGLRRRYRPVVLLNSWDYLILHLFVRPRFGYYAFGNYYGTRYNNFYQPWYAYHRSRGGYDPLYAHFYIRYGNDGYNRLVGWNTYFQNHSEFRPRTTYRAQREFFEQNRNNSVVAATSLASNFDQIKQNPKTPVTFRNLELSERTAITKSIQDVRKVSLERTRFEGRTKGFSNAKIQKPETQKFEIPKLVQQQKVPGVSDRISNRARFGAKPDNPDLTDKNQPDLPSALGNRARGGKTLPGKTADTQPGQDSKTSGPGKTVIDPKLPTVRDRFGNRTQGENPKDPKNSSPRNPLGNRNPGNTPTDSAAPKDDKGKTPAPDTKRPFTPKTPIVPKTNVPPTKPSITPKTPAVPKVNNPRNSTPGKPIERRTPTFKDPKSNSSSNDSSKFQNRPPPTQGSSKPSPPKIQTPAKTPSFTPIPKRSGSNSTPAPKSSSSNINRGGSSSSRSSFSKQSVPKQTPQSRQNPPSSSSSSARSSFSKRSVPQQTPQPQPKPSSSSSSNSSKSPSFGNRFQQRRKNN